MSFKSNSYAKTLVTGFFTLSLLLPLVAFAGGPEMMMMAIMGNGQYAPSSPVATATAGNGQVTITKISGGSNALRYDLLWSTAPEPDGNPPLHMIVGVTLPYVHTGLTNGVTYYYRLIANNHFGGRKSDVVNAIPTGGGGETIGSTVIGAATNGGYYAGTIVDGGTTYHLIAAPKGGGDPTMVWDSVMGYTDTGGWCTNSAYDNETDCNDSDNDWTSYGGTWHDVITTGITSVTAGPANTATLAGGGYGTRHSAALYCKGLTTGGKTDWYLPAKNELAVLYAAKGPFAVAGQAFINDRYWSSTEYTNVYAQGQDFSNGNQYYDFGKYSGLYVKAVRRLPI